MKALKSTLLIALLFIGASSYAQKFAYVDSQFILEKIPEYQQAQDELNALSAQWQKEIEALYSDIDRMYKEYQAEQVLLTEEMRVEKENAIIEKEKKAKQLQRQRFGPEGDLYTKRQELIKPIQDQIFTAVLQVAEEGNYDFIFDKSSDLIMLFTNPKYDKSNTVLDRMGYNY